MSKFLFAYVYDFTNPQWFDPSEGATASAFSSHALHKGLFRNSLVYFY